MLTGRLEGKIIVAEGDEVNDIYSDRWIGNLEGRKLLLDLVEAAYLFERGRLEIVMDDEKIDFVEFLKFCNDIDKNFMSRYAVYCDLMSRGLTVRPGYVETDFKVYERSAKQDKKVKWIVFVSADDSECEISRLDKVTKLAQNIRALALWAVVDADLDVTYYIINSISP
jgi:tRNA-intron lyase